MMHIKTDGVTKNIHAVKKKKNNMHPPLSLGYPDTSRLEKPYNSGEDFLGDFEAWWYERQYS